MELYPRGLRGIGVEDFELFECVEACAFEFVEHGGSAVFKRDEEVLFFWVALAGVFVDLGKGAVRGGQERMSAQLERLLLDVLDFALDQSEEEDLFHLVDVFPMHPDAKFAQEERKGR